MAPRTQYQVQLSGVGITQKEREKADVATGTHTDRLNNLSTHTNGDKIKHRHRVCHLRETDNLMN